MAKVQYQDSRSIDGEAGPPDLDRAQSPGGFARLRNREAIERWWVEEAHVERACRTLPFTMFFWIIFVGAQLSHRHVEQGFTLNRAMDRLLNEPHSDPRDSSTDSSSCPEVRRLLDRLDFKEDDDELHSSDDEVEAVDEHAKRRLATLRLSGLAGSIGIDIDSVQHMKSPNSVLDWVEETPVRVMWLDRNWNFSRSYVSHFNRVIGGIRLLQSRLPKADCPGSDELVGYYGLSCYDDTGTTSDPISADGSTRPGFSPVSSDGVSDGKYVFWIDIGQTLEETQERLQYLRDLGWLDSATDTVEVQVALYNGETGMFIFARVIFTLDRTGYLAKKILIASVTSNVYASMTSVAMDVMLLLSVAVLFFGQLISLYARLKRGDNLKSIILRFQVILNLTICFIGFGLGTYFGVINIRTKDTVDTLVGVPQPPTTVLLQPDVEVAEWKDRHTELNSVFDKIQSLGWYQEAAEVAVFWYILLLVVKFFEAFSGIPRLAVITKTLQLASWDLVHFLLVFGIIFASFSVGAFFLFGQKILEWSTPGMALNTSFRALMGDFDFASMYEVAPVSSTVWFWSYMMLIFLVMLNMLLAIIMDTYCEVKDQSKSNADILTAAKDVVTALRLKRAGVEHDKILEQVQQSGQDVTEDTLMLAGIPAGAARHMVHRIQEAKETEAAGNDENAMSHSATVASVASKRSKATTASPPLRTAANGETEVEEMTLPGQTTASVLQARKPPRKADPELEDRVANIERLLALHFNIDMKVH